MGKYFGTDGFRGEAGITLTADHAYKVGRFLGWYYNALNECNGDNEPARIVIGKDTRRSSYMFEYSLVAGLTASGADAYLLHVTTTPSAAYIARVDDFNCGIMISASHNPYYDNGIKLIDCYGEKMPEEILLLVEDYIDGKLHVFDRTGRSCARTEADLEEIDKLQSYLERNAPYIPSLSQRGIHTEIHLGTAETNHRFYSYRMKRQGRSWSSEGMEYMVWVLTARKNKTLTQALLYHANGKSYKKIDRAMHKAVVQAERRMRNYRPGCLEGRIGVYGASSSPMGRLARAIQKY